MENNNQKPANTLGQNSPELLSDNKLSAGRELYRNGFKKGYAIAINEPEKVEELLKTHASQRSYDVGIRRGIEAYQQQQERKTELEKTRTKDKDKTKSQER